jgi:hypothetical protein
MEIKTEEHVTKGWMESLDALLEEVFYDLRENKPVLAHNKLKALQVGIHNKISGW